MFSSIVVTVTKVVISTGDALVFTIDPFFTLVLNGLQGRREHKHHSSVSPKDITRIPKSSKELAVERTPIFVGK